MIKHLALVAPLALIVLFLPAFAQEPGNATQNDLQLDTPSGVPMLEQISEKGIYRVLLRWPQETLNPQAIEIEIVFLNASAPEPTAENIPQRETNKTGASTPGASGFNDPSIIESTLPVESYNMTVYAADGRELWKKVDQPGLGGRGTQKIDFAGNYTGPITINITDIRPGWELDGTTTAEDLTDSVTFTATVVPEFPVAAVLLAAGVGVTIALVRLKWTRLM